MKHLLWPSIIFFCASCVHNPVEGDISRACFKPLAHAICDGHAGSVTFDVTVAANGKISSVRPVQPHLHPIDQSAAACMMARSELLRGKVPAQPGVYQYAVSPHNDACGL
jgi:hypothetical protein